MIRINTIKSKKGQAVIEFSLLLVVAVVAYVSMRGFVNRSIQGRMRSSTDSIGGQFSAGHTTISRIETVESSVTEQSVPDSFTRNTRQEFHSSEHQAIDPFTVEYKEL